jgi:hypothetical protein
MATPTLFGRDNFDVRPGPNHSIVALFKPIGMTIEFDVLGKENGWVGPPRFHPVSNLGGYDREIILDEATRLAIAQVQQMFA